MGKIVKFCSSCDEGFAEKFGFCPNCGQSLQTFEMSPVEPEVRPVQEAAAEPAAAESIEPVVVPTEIVREAAPAEIIETVEEEPVIEEPVIDEPVARAAPPKTAAAAAGAFVQNKAVDVDRKSVSLDAEHSAYLSRGDFYVTVIEEKNVRTRNGLLAGTLGLMIFALLTGLVINLFSKDLDVGSINDDIFNAVIVDNVPMNMDDEQKRKDDDAGGGGGGGREEEKEVNRGDLADQTPNPQRPPQALPRYDTSMPLPPASTQGNHKFTKTYNIYGNPNGTSDDPSNGTGSGGGMGSGRGTGQGNGNGTGAGNGNGSGLGNGNGNGSGDGDGDGFGAPPPKRPGVTQAMRIINKPKPPYTDAARTNATQGTVVLKVTFLASGQIGSVSAVKGLPYGLTESAIAAARRISFEPKKVDGVPQAVIKTVEYTFGIY